MRRTWLLSEAEASRRNTDVNRLPILPFAGRSSSASEGSSPGACDRFRVWKSWTCVVGDPSGACIAASIALTVCGDGSGVLGIVAHPSWAGRNARDRDDVHTPITDSSTWQMVNRRGMDVRADRSNPFGGDLDGIDKEISVVRAKGVGDRGNFSSACFGSIRRILLEI